MRNDKRVYLWQNGIHGKNLCSRHMTQMHKYGKTFKTMYDSNEIIKYDDYAEVVICNRELKEIGRSMIDLEDIELISKYKWHISCGYVGTGSKSTRMHTILMNSFGCEVDHINHNKTDNRKENLRIVSRSQNNMNHKTPSHNSSGYKGVSWVKSFKKWVVNIGVNGKNVFIGYFLDINDAIKLASKQKLNTTESTQISEVQHDNTKYSL